MNKTIKYILFAILGGIALMTVASMNGWRIDGEYPPKNRTKEQYEFERNFNPIIEFLAQEKKDFTELKAYRSDIYIENEGEDTKTYELTLDVNQSEIKGDYEIKNGEDEQSVPVTYSDGQLTYGSEVSPKFDEEILNLVIKQDYFEGLDVKEIFESSETELKDIIYQPENKSELFKVLKAKYDLPEGTECRIRLRYSSHTIYGITIQLESQKKTVQIRISIFEKGGNT